MARKTIQEVRWIIQFFFDDDPAYSGAMDEAFYSREDAIYFVESQLDEFFPFAVPVYEKVLKVEFDEVIRWSYKGERVETKQIITQ
jgi:hypothetical protein